MVRGRRVRAAKTADEGCYASPKRKDSRLENIVNFANGVEMDSKTTNGDSPKVPSPPATRSKNNPLNKNDKCPQNGKTIKTTQITNYFQVVSPTNCFEEARISKIPSLKQENFNGNLFNGTRIEDRDYSEENGFHTFGMDRYMGFDEISKIIHTVNDRKKEILNNIFKKEIHVIPKCDEARASDEDIKTEESVELNIGAVKLENGCSSESESSRGSGDSDQQDSAGSGTPNVRLSPRKHASTLQRCVTVKENVKTPHRIRLCEGPQLPGLALSKTCRRLAVKSPDAPPPPLEVPPKANAASGARTARNRVAPPACPKLTDYFPVRRSVRKTKKEVLEEKRRDLEAAILEEREEGLEVATFEGKGRGVVAARAFERGEFVVEYCGELVDVTEARQREALYAQDTDKGCYMYYFRHNNNHYCIDATAETGRLGRLVNHSRSGNLLTRAVWLQGRPRLVLLAAQPIARGEELTYDYGDRSREALQHHPWLAL